MKFNKILLITFIVHLSLLIGLWIYQTKNNEPFFKKDYIKFMSSVFPMLEDIDYLDNCKYQLNIKKQTIDSKKFESKFLLSFNKFNKLKDYQFYSYPNNLTNKFLKRNLNLSDNIINSLPVNISCLNENLIFYSSVSFNIIRKLSKFLKYMTLYYIEKKEYKKAENCVLKCFILSEAIKKGANSFSTTLSYMIGIAVEGIAIESGKKILETKIFPKKLKYELGYKIKNILKKRLTLKNAIKGFQNTGNASIKFIRKNSPIILKILDLYYGYPEKQWDEIFKFYINSTKLNYPEKIDIIDKKLDFKTLSTKHFIIYTILPNMRSIIKYSDEKLCKIKLLSLSLMLSSLRKIPKKLSENLGELKIDPFSGKEFIYYPKNRIITINYFNYKKILTYSKKEDLIFKF